MLLGMPPSRMSSVTSSLRRFAGDGTDPHEGDSVIEERLQTYVNGARNNELGNVTLRPPLRIFMSS
jgi:hypothetical protein